MQKFAVGYEKFCRVIWVMFNINMAFIVHTVMGLILVGFFPSVAATYSTVRTWLLDEDHSWIWRKVWKVFHEAWGEEIAAANGFGWAQFIAGAFLFWDYYVVNNNNLGGRAGIAVSGILLAVNVIYWLFALMSWAVRAHFDEKIIWIIRMSVSMCIARPLSSLLIIMEMILTVWVWVKWPGILVTFGIVVPLFLVIVTIYSFARIPGFNARSRIVTSGEVQSANSAMSD
ncbi:YesL family protein [Alloscardovia venturai]|uniref:YesL family protein n=1 Tax=Alloscardovia venturai TaxID=1769421 RepID=A0ABW2Y737_9BIFI